MALLLQGTFKKLTHALTWRLWGSPCNPPPSCSSYKTGMDAVRQLWSTGWRGLREATGKSGAQTEKEWKAYLEMLGCE